MKQMAKETLQKNMHHHNTMETISKAYLSNQECSVKDATYHILLLSLAVNFFDTNSQEERSQIFLSVKNLNELPEGSLFLFKKKKIDRYIERPSATLSNGKYSVLNNYCYVEFLVYYKFESK